MSYVVYKEIVNNGVHENWYYSQHRTRDGANDTAMGFPNDMYGHVCNSKDVCQHTINNLPDEFYEEYRIRLVCGNTVDEFKVYTTKSKINQCWEEARKIVSDWLEDETNVPDGYEDCHCDQEFYVKCFNKHFNIEQDNSEIIEFEY